MIQELSGLANFEKTGTNCEPHPFDQTEPNPEHGQCIAP